MKNRSFFTWFLLFVFVGTLLQACSEKESDDESIPLPEHPRPDFVRTDWVNLNGYWNFEFDGAQRIRIYTTQNYIDILESLLKQWNIENITDINDSAEKARDYLMPLPKRLMRISDRIKIPEKQYDFKWIGI